MRFITLTLFAICTMLQLFGQEGVVSGTLNDETGLPLPYVNVIVKGTTNGTQTDFDGNYSIRCKVGDILVYSYLSYTTSEVVVSPDMLEGASPNEVPVKKVLQVTTNSYGNAIQKNKDSIGMKTPTAGTGVPYITNRDNYGNFYRIKRIEVTDTLATFEYYAPEVYYTLEYLGELSVGSAQSDLLLANSPNGFEQNIWQDHNLDFSLGNETNSGALGFSHRLTPDLLEGAKNEEFSALVNVQKRHTSLPRIMANVRFNSHNNNNVNNNAFTHKILRRVSDNSGQSSEFKASLFDNTDSKSKYRNFLGDLSLEDNWGSYTYYHLTGAVAYTNEDQDYIVNDGFLNNLNRYSSSKDIANLSTSAAFDIDFKQNMISHEMNMDVNASLRFKNQQLDYDFSEGSSLDRAFKKNKTTLELRKKALFDYWDQGLSLFLTLNNSSLVSSTQKNTFWNPSVKFAITPRFISRSDFIGYTNITIGYSSMAHDSPLFYNNYSHLSTNFSINDSYDLLYNTDLFTDSGLGFERNKSFEITAETNLGEYQGPLTLGFVYTDQVSEDIILPIYSDQGFSLENAARTRSKEWELTLEATIGRDWENAYWTSSLSFSQLRTNTERTHMDSSRIALAGFQEVGNYLVEGQPIGTILGTAYQRDVNGGILTDAQGVPLVDEAIKTIGDPTPDFNLGFYNQLKFKRFWFTLSANFQKGGDIWNGTQQLLESADIGSTMLVAEDGIEDGSYFNLGLASLSFELVDKDKFNDNYHDRFFTSLKVRCYGSNLFQWSASQGNEINSKLFDGMSAQGLQFFNNPIVREIGFSITAKI